MSEFSNHLFPPRPEFVWKFTRLKEQWQSAAQGVTPEEERHSMSWCASGPGPSPPPRGPAPLPRRHHLLSAVKSQDCHSLHQAKPDPWAEGSVSPAAVWEPQGAFIWKMFVCFRFCVFSDVQVCSLQWEASWSWGSLLSHVLSLVGSETQSYPFIQKYWGSPGLWAQRWTGDE